MKINNYKSMLLFVCLFGVSCDSLETVYINGSNKKEIDINCARIEVSLKRFISNYYLELGIESITDTLKLDTIPIFFDETKVQPASISVNGKISEKVERIEISDSSFIRLSYKNKLASNRIRVETKNSFFCNGQRQLVESIIIDR